MLKNYKIKAILDHQGNDKQGDRCFYQELIGGFILRGELWRGDFDYYLLVNDCISSGSKNFHTSAMQEIAVSEDGKLFQVVDRADWEQDFQQTFLRITTRNTIYMLQKMTLDEFIGKNIVSLFMDTENHSFVGFVDYDDQKHVPLLCQEETPEGKDKEKYTFSIYGQKKILFQIQRRKKAYRITGQLDNMAIKLRNIGNGCIHIHGNQGGIQLQPGDEMIKVYNGVNGLDIFQPNQYNKR